MENSPYLREEAGTIPPPSVDMAALATRLRPVPRWSPVVLWWSIAAVMIAACAVPHPAAVLIVWLFVGCFVWDRERRGRVFRRNLERSHCLARSVTVAPREAWPKITALVPARNEQACLKEAARSLASLPYPNLHVWFIDDHSTDETPRILDAVQQEFSHVRVLHNPPVAEGWFGKSNALWQAFLEIDRNRCGVDEDKQWLLFADADVLFEPGILEQAIAVAERDRLDFLTCMPRLITKTWAEQLLLPTGWRGIAQGADPDRLNDPKTFPVGIGAFMLVRYSSHKTFGGHQALGQWHPEDTLMAAAIKEIGGRVGFAWSPDLLRVRFYHGYGEVKKHTLRKTRIFFGDYIQLPLTMMALRLSTTLAAIPLMAAGLFPQVMAGQFDVLLTLLALAGVVLYVEEVREYKSVEKIAEFHACVPWLHPVSGVLRVWFALSLLGQILARKPMDWRGRREFGGSDAAATPPVKS